MLLDGGEALELAGLHVRRASPSRATRPRTSRTRSTARCFSGDVLFAGSVGRTDLPGGDWATLLASIRSLVERFPPETVVYPGPRARRRRSARSSPRNPFLAELRDARAEAAG